MNDTNSMEKTLIPDAAWKGLSQIILNCNLTATRKGWWEKYNNATKWFPEIISSKLMLTISELAEALEETRKQGLDIGGMYYSHTFDESGFQHTTTFSKQDVAVGWPCDSKGNPLKLKPEGFGVELADAVIRIFDLAAWFGVDLGYYIKMKMEYNEGRAYKHGGKSI